jgi:hypothetical protein
MRLEAVCAALDSYFRVPDVRGDDWSHIFDFLYPDPYWREFAEPGYEGRWNGLVVRGGAEVERAFTCVFPSDAIVGSLPSRTFLFSEHPIALDDDVEGFAPLARESFERLRSDEISFYHVHAPLDQHPEVAPSRLVAEGVGLDGVEEYFRSRKESRAEPRSSATASSISTAWRSACASSWGPRFPSTSSPARASRPAGWPSSPAAAPSGRSSKPRSSAGARRT